MPKQWKEWKELTEDADEADRAEESGLDSVAELPPPDEEGLPSPAGTQAQAEGEAEPAKPTELELLQAERDQLLERIARMQAEFDNARKRAEREKAENREFATANVVEQFLPVIDNFELALQSKGSAEQFRSGVQLIVKQMEEVLGRMQVSAVPAVGEEFDPRIHEALGSVDRDDIPDQHVAEEIRRGYKLRDRLIRPALVRIAHNPKQVSE